MKKNLIFVLSFFFYSFNLFSQTTYCLGFGISPVAGSTTQVDVNLSIVPTAPIKLGTGNFVFTYNTAALSSPVLQSSSLGTGNGYQVATISPSTGRVSYNIELNTAGTGAAGGGLAVIRFTIVNKNASVNLTTVEGAVILDDEATRIFKSASCTVVSTSLPLDLLDFQVNNKGGQSQLSWLTASEVNVQGFDVERSATGKYFEKVGYVKSAGTPRGAYSFTDEVPVNGVNYYRLKIINTNGSIEYSPVRSVNFAENRTTGLSVSPNPAKEAVTVKLNAQEAKTMTLSLMDVAGKVVMTEQKKVEAGFNQLNLNLSRYPAGLYFLKVGDAGASEVHRLVIAE
jgi:hypothetical protein